MRMLILALAVLTVVWPTPTFGQEETAQKPAENAPEQKPAEPAEESAPAPVAADRLAAYASVYVESQPVREALQKEMSISHDENSSLAAREAADKKLAEIRERHKVTPEEYEAFIARISVSAEARAAFEKALEGVRAPPEGGKAVLLPNLSDDMPQLGDEELRHREAHRAL